MGAYGELCSVLEGFESSSKAYLEFFEANRMAYAKFIQFAPNIKEKIRVVNTTTSRFTETAYQAKTVLGEIDKLDKWYQYFMNSYVEMEAEVNRRRA